MVAEWYTDTGVTVVTATAAVTYSDGSTGNLTAVSLAATRRASFMQPLNGLIPAAVAGKFIRAVNTVTLSATTGTAAVLASATRLRGTLYARRERKIRPDWAEGLPISTIPNNACPFIAVLASTTSTGTLRGENSAWLSRSSTPLEASSDAWDDLAGALVARLF